MPFNQKILFNVLFSLTVCYHFCSRVLFLCQKNCTMLSKLFFCPNSPRKRNVTILIVDSSEHCSLLFPEFTIKEERTEILGSRGRAGSFLMLMFLRSRDKKIYRKASKSNVFRHIKCVYTYEMRSPLYCAHQLCLLSDELVFSE